MLDFPSNIQYNQSIINGVSHAKDDCPMSLPKQIAAYDDCFEIFDKAAASSSGMRVQFATYAEARLFQLRMNQARALDRTENRRLYPPDDLRWGKSLYDKLVMRMPREDDDGLWWVYIEHHGSNILAVEEIGAPTDAP